MGSSPSTSKIHEQTIEYNCNYNAILATSLTEPPDTKKNSAQQSVILKRDFKKHHVDREFVRSDIDHNHKDVTTDRNGNEHDNTENATKETIVKDAVVEKSIVSDKLDLLENETISQTTTVISDSSSSLDTTVDSNVLSPKPVPQNPEKDTASNDLDLESAGRTNDKDTEIIHLENVRTSIVTLKGKKWVNKHGKVNSRVINLLLILQKSENLPDSLPAIANILLEHDTIGKICDLVLRIQHQISTKKFSEPIQTLHYIIGIALGILVNYTDASETVTETVTQFPQFLQVLHQLLVGFCEKKLHKLVAVTEEDVYMTCVLNAALSIVYNISIVESNVAQLRKLNFTEALQPYLKSKDKDDHLTALAALAAIVDEKESEIINSNRKVVKHLMKVLRRALRSGDRRYDGWSCKELALVIRTLARNDANKKLLVQLGALQLLVKLSTGSQDETIEALGAIWALSFDADNRGVMLENEDLGLITMLAALRDNGCEKIKTAATGALWNLREELQASQNDSYKAIGESIVSQGIVATGRQRGINGIVGGKPGEGHIMISYQWGNQKTLIDIRNELNKHGFKVWMDVDNMAGSTLQAMAEAIEEADIVLLCYSQKYKNSPNCRAEAEYTFQRQKPFIPLRMEKDYKPDGWLGILVGTKLFYDFSGKYSFQDKLNKLLKDIAEMNKQTQNTGAVIPLMVPTKHEPVYHHQAEVEDRVDSYHGLRQLPTVTEATADRVRSWSTDDVRNWKRKHNISQDECGSLTADEIALLIEMKKEAPEAFYKGLQKKFNYDLRQIAQLVKALKAIET